jgi:hypothetical protein
MNTLIVQLVATLAPIFLDAYKHYTETHAGEAPTDEQLAQELRTNIELYLGEGSSWRAAHPDA